MTSVVRRDCGHCTLVDILMLMCCVLQVLPGGLVIWRSAAIVPPYAKLIENAGFNIKCLQQAQDGYMDRVNMYCSFWVAERR